MKSKPTISGGQRNEKKKVEEYVIDPDKILKYTRGARVKTKKVKDRRLKTKLQSHEKQYDQAIKQAARSELLLTEQPGYIEAEGIERTHKFKQKDIVENLDITSAQKYFELKLDQFGPYKVNYTRNGKHLLIAGQKGHLASIDWMSKNLSCEVHTQETVRDVKWLHQHTFFAAAQKKYVFIYDNEGTEIHRLKDHQEVNRMEYLPYHFLLATAGNHGFLKYQDTSTGKLVSSLRSKLGRCDCMSQNPYNAVVNLGHQNGCVTMWSPVVKEPLVKMLCHRGPVLSTAVDSQGVYMATSGMDGLMKVWDIRMYKQVYKYNLRGRPAHCLSISQKGMLAAAFGCNIYVFKDALSEKQGMPYLQHTIQGADISSIQFCPYEDVLGVGHTKGFTSLLVPGSGEANFDGLEANPYETKKQRQEHEVKMLLEKIQPEMIGLNPAEVVKLDNVSNDIKKGERDDGKEEETFQPKYKMKGKSSTARVVKRKKGVEQLSKRDQLKANMIAEKKKQYEKNLKTNNISEEPQLDDFASALDRFAASKKK